MITKAVRFIKTDIWRIRLRDLPRAKSFLINLARIILLAFRGFAEDKCQLRASALTFYTLLSIVPIAAMAFGIAKGFGFEKLLEQQILERFPGQQEVVMQVVDFSHSLLENTRGGLIAGIGVAILFWTVIKVLGNIERSFNDIWGIKEQRSLGRKFSDYLSIMLICPILLILSGSTTVFITAQVTMITEKIGLLGFLAPLISFFLKLLPYGVIMVVFSFIYVFLPNTKVNIKSGIVAGIVAGIIYQAVQWGYITFQIGVAKYNAIYGSFAALPLFLVWLQLSWLIVLFGAEISFAHQNVDTYEFEQDCLRVSSGFKRLLALRIAQLLVKNFAQGKKPWTDVQISQTLEIPVRLVRQILYELTESGILSETKVLDYKQLAYQPALDIDRLTVKYVLDSLERRGTDTIPVVNSKELEKLAGSLKSFQEELEKSPANLLLKEV